MLSAIYNNQTGQLIYTVNGVRGAGRYVDQVDAQGNPVSVTYSDGTVAQARVYESDVKTMIALLQRERARASGGCPRAGAMESVRRIAANDNHAWREAAFRFAGREMVA
jgi:hypothetical protein